MSSAATLLVDDDVGFSASILSTFSESEVLVDWAQGWVEGLELFRVVLHELVIADYNLPRSEHGLKLLAGMKPLRPSSRLILISAALTSKAEEIVKQTRLVDRYLAKTEASFAEELVGEVRRASRRASEPSDWHAVATGYVTQQSIYSNDIKRIDALLQGELKDS